MGVLRFIFAVGLHFHFWVLVTHALCHGERSQRGFALLNKSYSARITNGYSECVGLCFEDSSCMSLNFTWDTKKCELNQHTRESCPKCYVNGTLSTYMGMGRHPDDTPYTCSTLRNFDTSAKSGKYVIDPDGPEGNPPFNVTCDMTDKNGVGVTIISHDSEKRTLVKGYENPGSYSRDVHYIGASLSQLAGLTRVSSHCEQFIKYECYGSIIFGDGGYAWWMSRDHTRMTYWGGASPGSGKCACGMNSSCVVAERACNCDRNDAVYREDSGFLTDKTSLPVSQLRFGDTGHGDEEGYHTLGKFKCYGIS